MIIGCFGGGSNFGGICFPFMRHTILNGKQTRYIAAEPASCPKLTRGKFQYDFGDEAGYTPLLPMFTLGIISLRPISMREVSAITVQVSSFTIIER